MVLTRPTSQEQDHSTRDQDHRAGVQVQEQIQELDMIIWTKAGDSCVCEENPLVFRGLASKLKLAIMKLQDKTETQSVRPSQRV